MPRLVLSDISKRYDDVIALDNVSFEVQDGELLVLVGPSGCGKSTFLRCVNRMNDVIDNCRTEGKVLLEGTDVEDPSIDPVQLRARVGMVFQRPNPFPKSIYENVVYGLRLQGIKEKRNLDEVVEQSLRGAALWDEV